MTSSRLSNVQAAGIPSLYDVHVHPILAFKLSSIHVVKLHNSPLIVSCRCQSCYHSVRLGNGGAPGATRRQLPERVLCNRPVRDVSVDAHCSLSDDSMVRFRTTHECVVFAAVCSFWCVLDQFVPILAPVLLRLGVVKA